MRKRMLPGSGCLFVCAMLMVITVTSAGTHQLNVGPREALYVSEDKQFREFTTGLTFGYQYSLLAADMFRIKFGFDNIMDIFNGSTKNGYYTTSGLIVFVEPGAELLFYLLMPFTARMQVGLSDQFIRSAVNYNNADMRGYRNTTNRFGMYFSPGLFFQTDKGHIGVYTKHRFHTGVTSYEGGNADDWEHSQKMFDWGFQGGFITGKISHTIQLESSRATYKFKNSDVWSKWNSVDPKRRFSYTIGINIPSVLKMEKTGESTTLHPQTKDLQQKKQPEKQLENEPVIKQNSTANATTLTETSINLQGDVFKPRCKFRMSIIRCGGRSMFETCRGRMV